jgi:hypothetical protein
MDYGKKWLRGSIWVQAYWSKSWLPFATFRAPGWDTIP